MQVGKNCTSGTDHTATDALLAVIAQAKCYKATLKVPLGAWHRQVWQSCYVLVYS